MAILNGREVDTSIPYITEGAEKEINSIRHALRRFVWATVGLYLAVVSIFLVGYVVNSNRIDDIQNARKASCQRTYEGIHEVFTPFFAPVKERTPEQQADIDLFNKTIKDLKANCGHQTKSNQ